MFAKTAIQKGYSYCKWAHRALPYSSLTPGTQTLRCAPFFLFLVPPFFRRSNTPHFVRFWLKTGKYLVNITFLRFSILFKTKDKVD